MVLPVAAWAEDILDEDALFADSMQVVDSTIWVENAAIQEGMSDEKTVGFSGNILSLGQVGATRSWMGDWEPGQTSFGVAMVGDIAIDVRMQRGFKAFADLEWSYTPAVGATGTGTDSGASWRVPEMFLDANIAHRAYFRVGKQVLQWGRCEFFNPTDLVNVERKSFFTRIGNREGAYGAKVHVPFGTVWNLYGFLDAGGAQRADSLAGAAKAEVLIGGTEVAVMAWDGGYRDPVYGADFSTRLLSLDVTGEAAWHRVFSSRRILVEGGMPLIDTTEKPWTPRLALGVGRSFDLSGFPDRATALVELYYNGGGSTASRMGLSTLAAPPEAAAGLAAITYGPHSVSRRYAAFFGTFNRFVRSDMALVLNAIANLDQGCALISSGVTYRDLNDFSLSFFVHGFAGPEDTEYTLSGQAVQVQLIAEAAF